MIPQKRPRPWGKTGPLMNLVSVALLVAQGAHALEIKHRLGHESITVTMDTYGHLLPSLEGRIVSGLDATYEAARTV
jgi:integrase